MSSMKQNIEKEIIRRISIAQGHLEKVKKMIKDGAYCPDVIHQSRAVQAALKKVDEIVFESHLDTCVLAEMKGNKEKLAQEIIELFKKNK